MNLYELTKKHRLKRERRIEELERTCREKDRTIQQCRSTIEVLCHEASFLRKMHREVA